MLDIIEKLKRYFILTILSLASIVAIYSATEYFKKNTDINLLYNTLSVLHTSDAIDIAVLFKEGALKNEVIFYINSAEAKRDVYSFVFSNKTLQKRGFKNIMKFRTKYGILLVGWLHEVNPIVADKIYNLVTEIDKDSIDELITLIEKNVK